MARAEYDITVCLDLSQDEARELIYVLEAEEINGPTQAILNALNDAWRASQKK